jgi:hypothetical protein
MERIESRINPDSPELKQNRDVMMVRYSRIVEGPSAASIDHRCTELPASLALVRLI